jgi:hypothetical protein
MSFIVCEIPADFDTVRDAVWYGEKPNADLMRLDFRLSDVRFKLSAEEKAERKRKYRRDYNQKPENKLKQKERLAKPEEKKKRQEYQARQEVIERKRKLSALSRIEHRILKEKNPEEYKRLQLEAKAIMEARARYQDGSTTSRED